MFLVGVGPLGTNLLDCRFSHNIKQKRLNYLFI